MKLIVDLEEELSLTEARYRALEEKMDYYMFLVTGCINPWRVDYAS